MIKFYYGDEPYMARQLKHRIHSACTPETEIMEKDTFDSSVCSFADTASFFSERKLLLLYLKELPSGQEFVDFISKEHMADIYIICLKADSRLKNFKLLAPYATKFERPERGKLMTFLKGMNEWANDGLIGHVIERSGYLHDEQVALDSLIICLQQLSFESAPSKEAADRMLSQNQESRIWQLFGYLANGDLKSFYEGSRNENPISVLSILHRNLRIGYKMLICPDRVKEIGAGSASSFRFISKTSTEQIAAMLDAVTKGISNVKAGRKNVLETTAYEICKIFKEDL